MEVPSKGMDLWLLFLLVVSVSVCIVLVDGQADKGFISIDCGLDANSTYSDKYSGLLYVSDDNFIDTGVNYKISPQYAPDNLFKQFLNVRSFPSGTRNCYTLRSLTKGSKYLVKGLFMYGNYDKLSKPPIFSLYLGVNYWDMVNITTMDGAYLSEIIAIATSDSLQVCLINENRGTPFISALELRPMESSIYAYANSTQSLVLFDRINLGEVNWLRFPDDLYDRIWAPYMEKSWKNISTPLNVSEDLQFVTPSIVLQTAATPSSINQNLTISWTKDDKLSIFYVILHFSEIHTSLPPTALRKFDLFAQGAKFYTGIVPPKLQSFWFTYLVQGYNDYNLTLLPTSDSTLPPILNAYELFIVRPATGIPTNIADATAIHTIKATYRVKKGWSGDPCVPTDYPWTGVNCTFDSNKIPRITTLDLSSSRLTGAIISSFGDLSALKSLDLSNNDLSGDLPSFLDKLSALTYLDITGNNKLSSTLPSGLQSRKNDGSLTFKSGSANRKKSSIGIIVAVVGVAVLLLIAATIIIVVCLRRQKHRGTIPQPQAYSEPQNIANTTEASVSNRNGPGDGRRLDFENRRFSYNDLVRITNKFQNNIGTGGFGSVYVGTLEDNTQVAVKVRSHSSAQGVKEFLAEAQNLARVHHRNLVSLLGYCMDGECMALVYEYMQEGTLQNKLMDNARPLSWKERVRIAYESALGLEYLHKLCNPPLIHRDVKTSNILLNENLEARIADFGLSRAFNSTASTHVSTVVVGTPGYLDPEYYSSYQLSEKSDVFSFGVVLLEIITGRSPTISGPEGGHLKEWVNQKLSRGDIESIVDPRMNGYYDINSVWKVTELARKCTEHSSAPRPTMSMVAAELKESLDLEISTEGTRGKNTTYNMPHNYSRNENFVSDVSQGSVFEMGYMDGGMSGPGPIAR